MRYDAQGRPIPDEPKLSTIRKKCSVQAAIKAGEQIAGLSGKPQTLQDGLPYAVLPKDLKLHPLGDFLLKAPLRLKASPTFIDTQDFIAYVIRFKTEHSLIFADPDNDLVRAVIDYHQEDGNPAWCEHVATLKLHTSPEWGDWSKIDRKDLGQEEFANFLEDHLAQIARPDGKTLMDAITKIKLIRTQTTKAVRNLATGEVQLTYNDEETGGEGTTKPPTELGLILRYFRGQQPFQVTARLRYRPKNTGVAFSFLINDLDKIQEKTFSEVSEQIREATGAPVYLGKP